MRFVDTNVLLYAISRDEDEDEKAQRFVISYWDAAIIEAAHAAGCDVVLSEDLDDGQRYDGVRVLNPFA